MTLKEIEQAWDDDKDIDEMRLDTEALSIPKLYSKYMRFQNAISKDIIIVEAKIDALTVEKVKFYKGWTDRPYAKKIVNATDLKLFIEGDADIIALKKDKKLLDVKFKTLDKILKQIEHRGLHIRAALDYQKFVSGSS